MRGNAFVLVALAVLCPLAAASAAPSARKAELLARAPRLQATPAAAKVGGSPVVDCTRGDSLQQAIDKSLDGDGIEVRELCHENVRVMRKRLTLHGLDPLVDGIAGLAAAEPSLAALEVWYSDGLRVENLSFVHPTGHGLGLWYSQGQALNCRMAGNAANGVHVSVGSGLNATAAMYGAGPFAGQLTAEDHGEIQLYGAQQTATGVGPSGNPLANFFDRFSMLVAHPSPENGLESQLKGHTQVSGFSRALLRGATTVDGTLACDSAADAWKDPGVIVTGSPVTGCEHVP